VDRVLYSVPWRFIGTQVDARVTDRVVQIFAAGELIKTWLRAERGRCTDNTDYPPEKVAFFLRTPAWCHDRAEALGAQVTNLVCGLLAGGALHHLRSAQGILALAEKYGGETGRPPDRATPPAFPTIALPLRCGPRPPLDPLTSTQPRMIMRWPPYLRDRHAEDHNLRLEY
jgi:hypothetical protein